MLIFLVGFMGSGKSFCGEKIAVHYNVPFFDLDAEVEKAVGTSISTFFAIEGETAFRKKEAGVLREIVDKFTTNVYGVRAVVSCGGGTPCFHDNMGFMNQHGVTIWVNPPVGVLFERLKTGQEQRPLIAGLTLLELENFIINKLEERTLHYEKATLHINSNECAIDLIEKKLNNG